jgi:ribonuclease-3
VTRAKRRERSIMDLVPAALREHPVVQQALVHKSASRDPLASNERLEFLGDAVIELVVSDFLYRRYPDVDEGRLTQVRSALVSRRSLGAIGVAGGLLDAIKVGQADALGPVLAANAVEALAGAVYLAGGFQLAVAFVLAILGPSLERVDGDLVLGDYKSLLHQALAKLHYQPPRYKVSWSGPDHDRHYRVVVQLPGGFEATGEGASRKEAEQEACRIAIMEANRRAEAAGLAGPDEAVEPASVPRRRRRPQQAVTTESERARGT